MTIDFNTADKQQEFGLIPDGTIVPVMMSLRANHGDMPGMGPKDGGLFKQTNDGTAYMIDVEYIVTAGEFAKRKMWEFICAKGNGSDGHVKWENIAKTKIRAMLESAYNIDPDDDSDAAIAKRSIEGYANLHGLVFTARVGVEKSDDPQYSDKNVLRPVTPGDDEYKAAPPPPGGAPALPVAAQAAQPAQTANATPNW